MSSPQSVIAKTQKYFIPLYARPEIVWERGRGMYLFCARGKKHLDFAGGIAVNALGHLHPAIVRAIRDQLKKYIHVSNLYHTPLQAEVAELLVKNSFADRVFFCNSGTEAIEAAIKFARRWSTLQDPKKVKIISFLNSFHGRTYAALAATAQKKYQKNFGPMPAGFQWKPANNIAELEKHLDKNTAAVLIEPVQGEGGVNVMPAGFLRGLRKLADKNKSLLIFDEIQSGLGRTGKLFGYEHSGVKPDIMTLAKPLGGGLPLGAVLVSEAVSQNLHLADHGTTFGGNQVALAGAKAFLTLVTKKSFLAEIRSKGAFLESELRKMAKGHPCIKEIRGQGLIWGIELDREVKPVQKACLDQGLIVLNAGPRVIRLLPPYIVTKDEIKKAVAIIGKCLTQTGQARQAPANK
jgi:acetylornithine aminotransferase/acetylornithine/N-succinyldiaminopimelate aminotransferase